MPQELEATFDGTALQLEKPPNLAAGTKVRIIIEEILPNQPIHTNKLHILLQSLNAKEAQTRSQAALALGKLGSESAIPSLSKALNDEDVTVRQKVAEALGKIGERIKTTGDRFINIDGGNYTESLTGSYFQGKYINMSQDLIKT